MYKKIFIGIILSSLLFSCHSNVVYTHFQDIGEGGWIADSVITFEPQIEESANPYNIVIHVRHKETYPYQNMWLFINMIYDDSIQISNDTIDFMLANERGQWLGNHTGSLWEMPVLLKKDYHFPDKGKYIIKVQHGMRETALRGIMDIGLTIEK